SRDLPVSQLVLLPLSRLARVIEPHDVAANGDVIPAERREPVALVLVRVHLAPRPEETGAEDLQHAGEHLLLGDPWQGQVASHGATHFREHPDEARETFFLPALAPGGVGLVVEVLPSPGRV